MQPKTVEDAEKVDTCDKCKDSRANDDARSYDKNRADQIPGGERRCHPGLETGNQRQDAQGSADHSSNEGWSAPQLVPPSPQTIARRSHDEPVGKRPLSIERAVGVGLLRSMVMVSVNDPELVS
jgi:hypothetical protein